MFVYKTHVTAFSAFSPKAPEVLQVSCQFSQWRVAESQDPTTVAQNAQNSRLDFCAVNSPWTLDPGREPGDRRMQSEAGPNECAPERSADAMSAHDRLPDLRPWDEPGSALLKDELAEFWHNTALLWEAETEAARALYGGPRSGDVVQLRASVERGHPSPFCRMFVAHPAMVTASPYHHR